MTGLIDSTRLLTALILWYNQRLFSFVKSFAIQDWCSVAYWYNVYLLLLMRYYIIHCNQIGFLHLTSGKKRQKTIRTIKWTSELSSVARRNDPLWWCFNIIITLSILFLVRMKELWDESMKAMVNTQNPLFENNKKYYDTTIHRETLVK